MKKSEYKRYCRMRASGDTPPGGWGRAFGVGQTTSGKLSRKAAEGRVGARTVGVVSKAYEQMSKDRRAA